MKTDFQYLPVSKDNIDWGLYVTAVGTESVPVGCETYPLAAHPSMYDFTWEAGRVLPEYQVLYLTRGRMFFESTATGKRTIDAGHVVLLFPGVWHRYRPDPATGWEKYWLSANGEDLYRLVKRRILSPDTCILQVGLSGRIRRPYREILRRVLARPGGNSHLLAAYAMQLLAELLAVHARQARTGREGHEQKSGPKREDPVIGRALSYIWSHSHREMTVDELAERVQLSRRTLERRFRAILGKSVLEEITKPRTALAAGNAQHLWPGPGLVTA